MDWDGRNESSGYISITVSDPAGIDFGSLPYPLTPSREPARNSDY